jgi:hypothetical protein
MTENLRSTRSERIPEDQLLYEALHTSYAVVPTTKDFPHLDYVATYRQFERDFLTEGRCVTFSDLALACEAESFHTGRTVAWDDTLRRLEAPWKHLLGLGLTDEIDPRQSLARHRIQELGSIAPTVGVHRAIAVPRGWLMRAVTRRRFWAGCHDLAEWKLDEMRFMLDYPTSPKLLALAYRHGNIFCGAMVRELYAMEPEIFFSFVAELAKNDPERVEILREAWRADDAW